MKKKWALFMTSLILLGVVILLAVRANQTKAANLLTIYASPINAGCYITAPNQCKIHVDPFVINKDTALAEYRITVGAQSVYNFSTDLSNPPVGSTYAPSLVALDFAATCGSSYTISLQGRVIDNVNFYNLGSTRTVTCPSVVP